MTSRVTRGPDVSKASPSRVPSRSCPTQGRRTRRGYPDRGTAFGGITNRAQKLAAQDPVKRQEAQSRLILGATWAMTQQAGEPDKDSARRPDSAEKLDLAQ